MKDDLLRIQQAFRELAQATCGTLRADWHDPSPREAWRVCGANSRSTRRFRAAARQAGVILPKLVGLPSTIPAESAPLARWLAFLRTEVPTCFELGPTAMLIKDGEPVEPLYTGSIHDVAAVSADAVDELLVNVLEDTEPGEQATSPPSEAGKVQRKRATPESDDQTMGPRGNKGGRNSKWDHYWKFACDMAEEYSEKTAKEIRKAYQKKFGAAIRKGDRPDPGSNTLRNLRHDRTKRKR